MRTIKLNIYQFHELSEKAKEVAKDEMGLFSEYFWGTEAFDSLKEFFKRLDVELIDWDIDWDNPNASIVRYSTPTDSTSDITFDLEKDSLSGLWIDYTIMKSWNETKSIDETVHDFLWECQFDFEGQREDEYAEEYACNGNYEFLEDGQIYTK